MGNNELIMAVLVPKAAKVPFPPSNPHGYLSPQLWPLLLIIARLASIACLALYMKQ